MYNNSKPRTVIVPAGYEDSSSESDTNDFYMSGFSKQTRKKTNYRSLNSVIKSSHTNNTASGHQNASNDDDWDSPGDCGGDSQPSQRPPVESWGRSVAEAVKLACMRGNLDKLKQLLSSGYHQGINEFFVNSNETPLVTASLRAHHEIIDYLLNEKSADPNVRDVDSKITALMAVIGCTEDREDEVIQQCVVTLITAGADLDSKNSFGITALMIAIQRRRASVAKYLIEKGADVNATDPDGRTALFCAAICGDGPFCRLLLENNCDIQTIDKDGWTAGDLAQEKGFHKLADLLFIARDTKWKPNLAPSLMNEIDEEGLRRRKEASGRANSLLVKEESAIEMILVSADGGKYLENFRKHKISYLQYLDLDDAQLKEIGVDEVGVRMKVLDHIKSVHTARWHNQSVRRVAENKNITAAEAVCMMLNINEHFQLMSANVKSLARRIQSKPTSLQYDKERNKIDKLLATCQQSGVHFVEFKDNVQKLTEVLTSIQDYTELQIAGEIPERKFKDLPVTKGPQQQHMSLKNVTVGIVVFSALSLGCLKICGTGTFLGKLFKSA